MSVFPGRGLMELLAAACSHSSMQRPPLDKVSAQRLNNGQRFNIATATPTTHPGPISDSDTESERERSRRKQEEMRAHEPAVRRRAATLLSAHRSVPSETVSERPGRWEQRAQRGRPYSNPPDERALVEVAPRPDPLEGGGQSRSPREAAGVPPLRRVRFLSSLASCCEPEHLALSGGTLSSPGRTRDGPPELELSRANPGVPGSNPAGGRPPVANPPFAGAAGADDRWPLPDTSVKADTLSSVFSATLFISRGRRGAPGGAGGSQAAWGVDRSPHTEEVSSPEQRSCSGKVMSERFLLIIPPERDSARRRLSAGRNNRRPAATAADGRVPVACRLTSPSLCCGSLPTLTSSSCLTAPRRRGPRRVVGTTEQQTDGRRSTARRAEVASQRPSFVFVQSRTLPPGGALYRTGGGAHTGALTGVRL
ncbi:unnamed protein product [Gadus morhua 'NCC']